MIVRNVNDLSGRKMKLCYTDQVSNIYCFIVFLMSCDCMLVFCDSSSWYRELVCSV